MAAKLRKRDLQFIGSWEGFRSQPYNDAVGYATIGYGHLLHMSRVTDTDRHRWGNISRARGLALLNHDAQAALRAVNEHVHVRLSANERAALVSLAFNIGVGAFIGSTLVRLLNQGKKSAAADQFLRWDMAGGHVLEGLRRRRVAERALFRKGWRKK